MLNFYNKFSNTTISIILMLVSGFSFVVMHSAAKYLSDEVHIFEITFLRCSLVIFVLAPLIFKEGTKCFITKQPKYQFFRILTNSIAMLCFFLWTNNNNIIGSNSTKFNCSNFHNIFSFCVFKRKIKVKKADSFVSWFFRNNDSFKTRCFN